MKAVARAVLTAAILLAAPAAHAGDIDTTGGVTPAATGIQPFGSPDTATYGQTFTAGAGDNFLQSFSLYLGAREDGAGPVDFRGYIGTWTGSTLGSLLYTSDVRTKSTDTLTEFVFSTPDLALTPNSQYVAFLSTSALAPQPLSTFQMPFGTVDLAGGTFVYNNNGNDFSQLSTTTWSSFGNDVAFKADFSATAVGSVDGAVPEPATWAMMLVGFGFVGAAMRSAKRQRAAVRIAF